MGDVYVYVCVVYFWWFCVFVQFGGVKFYSDVEFFF